MSIALSQFSFAAGELTPSLWRRSDLAKVHAGLKTAHNVIVHPYGGASNRPGLTHIAEIEAQGAVRLIPFVFGAGDTTVLLFSDKTLRFLRNGVFVTKRRLTTKLLRLQTLGDEGGVFWAFLSGMGANKGSIYVPDRTFCYFESLDEIGQTHRYGLFYTGTWIQWIDETSTNLVYPLNFDTANIEFIEFDPEVGSGIKGELAILYTIKTPYEAKDLQALEVAQSYDVMILTHPRYKPLRLSREGPTKWELAELVVAPAIPPPSDVRAVPSTLISGIKDLQQYVYVATSISGNDEESLPSKEAPCASNLEFRETDKSPITNTITWVGQEKAARYRVYRKYSGVFGFIGSTDGTEFTDNNIHPNGSDTPPANRNPFKDQSPHAVTFFEQRLVFGGSAKEPQTIWTSGVGNFFNFNTSMPVKADQAATFTLAAGRLNAIKHFAVMSDLLAFTTGGEWRISGGEDRSLTATNVRAKLQSYHGCTDLPPLMLGKQALFADSAGIVHAISPNIYDSGQYSTSDLSLLSAHLFEGRAITAWAYEAPYLVWAVRDDGVLLSLTFLPDHDVVAWCRHTTDGIFKSIAAVPEKDGETAVYVVVRRMDRQFVERLAKRRPGVFAQYLDGCLTAERAQSQPQMTVVRNLFHLEGRTVTALADGNVIPGLVVRRGRVTLPHPASVVHVGLPYVSEIETLPLSFGEQTTGGGMPSKPKRVTGVTLHVQETRGVWAGSNRRQLFELKPPFPVDLEKPPQEATGPVSQRLAGPWHPDASVIIQQRDPLPMNILALTPEIVVS